MTATKEGRDAAECGIKAGQIPLPLPHRPSLGGEDFLVDPADRVRIRLDQPIRRMFQTFVRSV